MPQLTRRILIALTIIWKRHDIDQLLSDLRSTNPSSLNFCYLNINSVKNKFTDFQEIINGNVDVASIAKTKIYASFPSAQFVFEGYDSPYLLDISNKSGGILVYVKSSIQSRLREKCQYLELFWSKSRKIRTRITPNTDTFYAVHVICQMKICTIQPTFAKQWIFPE